MAVPALELRVQIANTAAFVNTRPVDLVLTPMAKVPDGKGGRKTSALPPRPPQRMRFIETSSVRAARRPTEIGSQFIEEATIIAVPETVMAVGDEFEWDGSTWRVDDFEFPNEWSIRATVLRYGR